MMEDVAGKLNIAHVPVFKTYPLKAFAIAKHQAHIFDIAHIPSRQVAVET